MKLPRREEWAWGRVWRRLKVEWAVQKKFEPFKF